jgi:preprotein translocase subunit SecE
MNSIVTYLKASYDELLTKVTWPTWKDLQANAIIVGVAAFIIALIIGLMDVFSNLLFSDVIYKITG